MAFAPMLKLLDGKLQFGALTVIEEGDRYISPSGLSYRRFVCRCVCGNEKLYTSSQLKGGKRFSCGCKVTLSDSKVPFTPPQLVDPTSLPKTVKDAIALGIKVYFTGAPCKHGHIAFRFVSNQWCSACSTTGNAAYRLKYPEKRWAHDALQGAKKSAKWKGVPFSITPDDVASLRRETCPALGIKLVYSNPGKLIDASATLDRTIPSLGYVMGNLVVISHKANRIKTNATASEIQKVASWLRVLEHSAP